jgi:predicted RNA-binding Zn ribbon-like protein
VLREDLVTGGAQPGGREPAPDGLRLVQDFVNTADRENEVELFDGPGGVREWLRHRSLPHEDVTPAVVHRLIEVREALRSVLLGEADARSRSTLDGAARRARLQPEFGADGARLVPAASGVDAALGEILATAFAAMVDGRWARLRACPRDVCGWVFYDRSPANRATWCSMAVCGNRVKAGTYYRRRGRSRGGSAGS